MKPKLTKEQRDAACAMYLTGKSAKAVGAHFGIRENSVCRLLKWRNIQRRHGSDSHVTYSFDKHAFDVLTPDSCYWAGFLFADGYLDTRTTTPLLGLKVAIKDRDHISSFKEFLKSTHPISTHTYVYTGTSPGASPTVSIRLRCNTLGHRLKALGMNLKPARVAHQTLATSPDFWRGVIDGDGWLVYEQSSGRHIIGLTGWHPLLEQFVEFCKNHIKSKCTLRQRENIYSIEIKGGRTGGPALILAKILYGRHGPVLARKKAIADSWPIDWNTVTAKHRSA